MTSASADFVLDEETLEDLGEVVEEKPPMSSPSPYSHEVRWYDSDMITVTGSAFNLAENLSITLEGEDSPDLDREAAIKKIKEELSGGHENPVYVSNDVLRILEEEDPAVAYMRFLEDDRTYPVRLRSSDVFFDRLKESDSIKVTEEVENWVTDKLEENPVVAPVLTYTSGRNLARKWPAAIGYQEENGIAFYEDDQSLDRHSESHVGNPHDLHTHIQQRANGEIERITIDLSRFSYDTVSVEGTDSGLAVLVDDEIVYSNQGFIPEETDVEELSNGLYEITPG